MEAAISPPTQEAGAIGRTRSLLVLGVTAYVAVLCWTYVTQTVPRLEYLGFGFESPWPLANVFLFVALVAVPIRFLPAEVTRPSDLFVLMQYLLVYIPSLLIADHGTLPALPPGRKVWFQFALLAGMILLASIPRQFSPMKWPWKAVPSRRIWTAILVLLALSLGYLWSLLGAHFQIVGIMEIYSIRDQVTEILEASGSRLGGYAFSWANGVFLPLLFARAIHLGRRLWAAAALSAFVLLYGVWGSKTSLLAPAYLLMFFWLLGKPGGRIPVLLCLGFVALLLPPVFMGNDGVTALLADGWVGIVHSRTFTVSGLGLSQYVDFFGNNPLTYGSHVTGLNWIIPYPYGLDVPRTVGFHFYGTEVTSNVNFWGQDGIASLGLVGIPLSSVAGGTVLGVLDAVSAHLPLRFVGTALAGVLISFLQISLFTALVTGGLFIMMAVLWMLPSEIDDVRPQPESSEPDADVASEAR